MNEFDILEFAKTKGVIADKYNKILDKGGIVLYRLGEHHLLRLSNHSLKECGTLKLIQNVDFTPSIIDSGEIIVDDELYYFLLIDYVKGIELYNVLTSLTKDQEKILANQIIDFMNQLHDIKGKTYDIGLYIPTIPNFSSSWKEGHLQYLEWLQGNIKSVDINQTTKEFVSKAFKYIYDNIDVLSYQTGPVLLHNDFHPQNIIINNGELSGVIDFECSQFGERDFELVHLVHWCIFPPDRLSSYDRLLIRILEKFQQQKKVDSLDIRLTIYQLEHEIAQLIWMGGKDEEIRVNQIKEWIDGIITKKFDEYIGSV